MPFKNILIVDDHQEIIQLLTDFLEIEGYEVFSAENGEKALILLNTKKIDCVILDIMMPKIDGFTLCKMIRKESEIPILILSAYQTDADKIRGLSLGADDYIVKTASPSEIVARVKAIQRRVEVYLRGNKEPRTLKINQLELNPDTRSVKVGNQEILLTSLEFNLLHYFMLNEGIVLTYEQLIKNVWPDEVTGFHSVRVHIANLREKLVTFNSIPSIKTIRSVGYKLDRE